MLKKVGLAAAALLAVPGVAQAAEGLNGAYYAGGYGGNISGAPTATFTATNICYPNCGTDISDTESLSTFLNVSGGNATGLSTDVSGLSGHALTLAGYIHILTGGLQTFGLSSDDGSYLQIDGQTVVNNAGVHSLTYAQTAIDLAAGWHSIYIYQEENAGVTGLSAWINYRPLTSNILSTIAVPEASTWAMMIVGVGFAGTALRRRKAAAHAA